MDLPPHLPRRVCGAVRRSDRKIPGSAGCGWLCVGHALRLRRLGLHALGDADGAGVGAVGGGLNCANFGIFPVNLCN